MGACCCFIFGMAVVRIQLYLYLLEHFLNAHLNRPVLDFRMYLLHSALRLSVSRANGSVVTDFAKLAESLFVSFCHKIL